MANQTQAHAFAEAPCSFNVKVVAPGHWDCMLTLRGDSGADLLPKALAALEWLAAHGFSPDFRPPASNGNGNAPSPEPQAVPINVQVCPVHHTAMKARQRDGQIWYSHKATDPTTGATYWCKGEVPA